MIDCAGNFCPADPSKACPEEVGTAAAGRWPLPAIVRQHYRIGRLVCKKVGLLRSHIRKNEFFRICGSNQFRTRLQFTLVWKASGIFLQAWAGRLMRYLFVPVCFLLITWSVATGPDPTQPLENFSSKLLDERSENIDTGLAPSAVCKATLPLSPLHTLLKPIIPRSRAEICHSLVEAATSNDLPAPFFIHLLFRESGFKSAVISPAGALGIAQFMPETAAERGLDNPFDPLQAIPASARLLRDLFQKFGNLGLAAAAYNAGPKRIEDWLANRGTVPQETQDYVNKITGRPLETWTFAQTGSPAVKLPQRAPCQKAAGLLAWDGPGQIPLPPRNPHTGDVSARVRVTQQRSAVRRARVLQADSDVSNSRQEAKPAALLGK
jgi:hypothetical protein